MNLSRWFVRAALVAAIPLRIYPPLSIVALVVALMSMVVRLWGLPALRANGCAYGT